MKIRLGKYVWNSKKCVPLQTLKYAALAVGCYFMMVIMYYVLLPYSTMA